MSQLSAVTLKSRQQMTSTAKIRGLMKADEQIETLIVVPPDGGWGWVVVIASFYCNFINDGVALAFGIFLETFVKEFNATKAQVSISNSIFQGFYFIIGPVVSGLANRYGFRACTIFGALISGSGYCLITADFITLRTMYIFHGLMGGIGAGFVFIPAVLTVGFYFERWRAVATAIAVSAAGFGTIVWPIIIYRLTDRYSWKTTLRILGGIQASCAIAGLCFRPLKPQKVVAEPNKLTMYNLPSTVSLRPKTRGCCNRLLCCCNCFENCHSNKKFPTMKEALNTNKEPIFYPTASRLPSFSINSSAVSIFALPSDSRRMSMISTSTYLSSFRRGSYEEEGENFSCWTHFQVIVIDRICFCCKSKDAEVSAQRPLYRDDIFYHGSLTRLPEYAAPLQDESKPATSKISKKTEKKDTRKHYHMHVTRAATIKDVHYDQYTCRLCPQAVTRIISTMLDFSLLKSPCFLILAANSYLACLGVYVPYNFMQSRGLDHNLTAKEATFQLSLLGISNSIGRCFFGIVASFPKLNVVIIFYMSMILSGLILIINEFYDTKYMMYATALIYGFLVASISTLKPLLTVDIMGLNRLTNAFGLMMLFQGIGVICGVPFAGTLRDITGTYFYSMIFAASAFILAGLVMLPLNKLNKKEKQKKETNL